MMLASLLGLTWTNIRARIVRKVPEPAVAAAETAVPLVAEGRSAGVGGHVGRPQEPRRRPEARTCSTRSSPT